MVQAEVRGMVELTHGDVVGTSSGMEQNYPVAQAFVVRLSYTPP